jgi:hypothetical protein
MDTLLPSRPSTYLEIIKLSLKLYRLSFAKVILLSLLFSITAFIPRLITDFKGRGYFAKFQPFSLIDLWIILLNLFLLMLFIGILWHVHCIIYKIREPIVEDVIVGLKKVLQVFIASVMISIILFALHVIIFGTQVLLHQYNLLFTTNPLGVLVTTLVFLAQIFLLLYFSILFIFVIPIIAIENKSILSAIDRSISLVWNHWWRVVSVQFTPLLCYFILRLIIELTGIETLIHFQSLKSCLLCFAIFHIIIFALFIPWIAAILLVQLNDLELRNKIVNGKK